MLFHREVYLPPASQKLVGQKFPLNYSYHAMLACVRDNYGPVEKPPFEVTITTENLIELEADEEGNLIKVVVRQTYDERRDISFAFFLSDGYVKSVWTNLATDKHSTLDKSKYVQKRI